MVDRHMTQLELSAHVTLEDEVDSKSHLLRVWAPLSPWLCCPLWPVTDGRTLSSDAREERSKGCLGRGRSLSFFQASETRGFRTSGERAQTSKGRQKMNLTGLSGHPVFRTVGRLCP